MRIIFVRHGEPDYAQDCLTGRGRQQAAAAAERLVREDISEIYSSPCGRAYETAAFTASRLKLPVTTLEFMREITWGGDGIPCKGHPWTLGDMMMEEGFDFRNEKWQEHPYFKGNAATDQYRRITSLFDSFLMMQGYRHEDRRFLCETGTDKTIAIFSHGGSGACVLSHLLHLPFPYVLSVMPYGLTSIIILYFDTEKGKYFFPRLNLFNDLAHTGRHGGEDPALQQES